MVKLLYFLSIQYSLSLSLSVSLSPPVCLSICLSVPGMVKLLGEAGCEGRLRSLTYVAIGQVSRRAPSVAGQDLALLQKLFDALTQVRHTTLY